MVRYEEDEKTMGSTAGSKSAVSCVTAPLAGSEMKLREVEPSRSCPRVIDILSLLLGTGVAYVNLSQKRAA